MGRLRVGTAGRQSFTRAAQEMIPEPARQNGCQGPTAALMIQRRKKRKKKITSTWRKRIDNVKLAGEPANHSSAARFPSRTSHPGASSPSRLRLGHVLPSRCCSQRDTQTQAGLSAALEWRCSASSSAEGKIECRIRRAKSGVSEITFVC